MWIKFGALILFYIFTGEKEQGEDHHSSDGIVQEEANLKSDPNQMEPNWSSDNGSELIEMNSSKTEARDIANPEKCVINENKSDFLKNSNICKACNNLERKHDSEHFCQICHSSTEIFF